MKRYVIKLYGIFRVDDYKTYVYKIALDNNIKGFIKNCRSFMLIDCEGNKKNIRTFILTIIKKPTDLIDLRKVEAYILIPNQYLKFTIIESKKNIN